MSFVRAANICKMRAATQNDVTFWSVFQFLRTFRTFLPFTIISNRYTALIFNSCLGPVCHENASRRFQIPSI